LLNMPIILNFLTRCVEQFSRSRIHHTAHVEQEEQEEEEEDIFWRRRRKRRHPTFSM
jgi:hypothetical protein